MRLVALVLVVVGVAVVAYFPHWNPVTGEKRSLPVHMDEYVHWGAAISVLQSGSVDAPDPFRGTATSRDFSISQDLHERGYHVYLAAFQDATGLAWITIFQFGPALVAVLAALAVYALAERWTAGVEAALWVAAVPTTLRFLGPGFLVPIAFTMPMLAFGLHIILHEHGSRSYIAIAILAAALWPIHAMGALIMLTFCVLAGLASLNEPARAAALIGTAAAPALVALPYYTSRVQAVDVLNTLPIDLKYLHFAGAVLFVFAALGVAWLCSRKATISAGIVLGTILSMGGIIIVWRAETGADLFGLYDRTITLLPFLAAIAGGAGVVALRRAMTRPVPLRRLAVTVAAALLIVQVGVVVALAQGPMKESYYEVVTAGTFEEYVSVRAALADVHRLAIVDGQTMPFTIATGIPTLFVFLPLSEAPPEAVAQFFEDDAGDTLFLLQSGATVVVTQHHVDNPYLVRLSESVYVLPEDMIENKK